MDTKTTLSYDIKPDETTRFAFALTKTGLKSGKKHSFILSRFSGTVEIDSSSRENSTVSFAVEASSVICKDKWVNESDRKKIQDRAVNEMTLGGKHQELTFVSTKVKQKSDTTFDVYGNLTVRGITKSITLELSIQPGKSDKLEMMGITNFKMSDFGIKPPSSMFGLIGTKDNMLVDFELVAIHKS